MSNSFLPPSADYHKDGKHPSTKTSHDVCSETEGVLFNSKEASPSILSPVSPSVRLTEQPGCYPSSTAPRGSGAGSRIGKCVGGLFVSTSAHFGSNVRLAAEYFWRESVSATEQGVNFNRVALHSQHKTCDWSYAATLITEGRLSQQQKACLSVDSHFGWHRETVAFLNPLNNSGLVPSASPRRVDWQCLEGAPSCCCSSDISSQSYSQHLHGGRAAAGPLKSHHPCPCWLNKQLPRHEPSWICKVDGCAGPVLVVFMLGKQQEGV